MSSLSGFQLYELNTLRQASRILRRGDATAIRRFVEGAVPPRWPAAFERQQRAELERLVELGAPEMIIEGNRLVLEPKKVLLERLVRSETLTQGDLATLALRQQRPIPREYSFIGWLADDERRRAGPGDDPFYDVSNADVRRALYGQTSLLVDETVALGEQRAWVLDEEGCRTSHGFFEKILETAPPPFEDYAAWYRVLREADGHDVDRDGIPTLAVMQWQYASALSGAGKAIRQLITVFATALRQKWCVQVVCE